MKISERRLRSIIRQVISESSVNPRLNVQFGIDVVKCIEEHKDDFIDAMRRMQIDEEDLSNDIVEDFLRNYFGTVLNRHGETGVKTRMQGNFDDAHRHFKAYLQQPEREMGRMHGRVPRA